MRLALAAVALLVISTLPACAPAASGRVVTLTAPADPFVSPGDRLRIKVWRAPDFDGEFDVAPDGTIVHPLFQAVSVAGLPLSTARERVGEVVNRYQRDAEILVELLVPVSVGGSVGRTNLYHVPYGTTITQAVAQAGGATDLGRLDRVRLIRGDQQISLDITDPAARYGRLPVLSGDQIFVGRRSTFNFWRDLFQPVISVATLGVSIARLATRR
jgi:polysaccharide export outer membrane protein